MAILAIGGNAKDVGKTALVCAIIAALRDFEWTAVKITGHDYDPRPLGASKPIVREETHAGVGTDTARFLAAGARRALLVRRSGSELPVEEIRCALGGDRNVIFESNRLPNAIRPDVCLALVGKAAEIKASFHRMLNMADALVCVGREVRIEGFSAAQRRFHLLSASELTPELAHWLRHRLNCAQP